MAFPRGGGGGVRAGAGTAVTRAFVLGAGLGTRLRPMTDHLPKPLIPFANRPLISYAFDRLIEAGIRSFVVNTHHLPEAYGAAFPDGHYKGCPIRFRHEPALLETGGGIRNIADLIPDEPFVVYNGDILSTLPLQPALDFHFASGNDVTLVLRSGGGPLEVSLEPDTGRLTDIGRRINPGLPGTHLFSGIYCLNPSIFNRIAPGTKISVVHAFLEMIREGAAIGGIVIDPGEWWDLGSRERYLAAHRSCASGAWESVPAAPWIDPGASVAPDARLAGAVAVGPGCRIGPGAQIENSVIWNNAEISPGSRISDCVVLPGSRVCGNFHDATLSPAP